MKQLALIISIFTSLIVNYESFSQNTDTTRTTSGYDEVKLAQLTAKMKVQKKMKNEIRVQLDGKKLSGINLKDIQGNIYNLESLKGQVVLINFWFIHCKPCVEEIPDLNKLKSRFHKDQVKFLAVALDDKDALLPFLEKNKFDFTIIPNGGTFSEQLGIPHYPFHVLIDKEGGLHYVSDVFSFNMMNRLKRKIKQFL